MNREICQHPEPHTFWKKLWHLIRCGRITEAEMIRMGDCEEGCGCWRDPTSPDYWKKHLHVKNIELRIERKNE